MASGAGPGKQTATKADHAKMTVRNRHAKMTVSNRY